MPIETPGRRGLQSALLQVRKRVGGVRAGVRARHSVESPGKAQSPGEHPARAALTAPGERGTLERGKAREPRPAVPARGFVQGNSGWGNGRRVRLERERSGNLSRGESSEGH